MFKDDDLSLVISNRIRVPRSWVSTWGAKIGRGAHVHGGCIRYFARHGDKIPDGSLLRRKDFFRFTVSANFSPCGEEGVAPICVETWDREPCHES